MAEEGNVSELEGLEKQLHSLLSRYTSDELRADGKPFCSDFCKLVEEYTSRWQVPLPQLRILEIAFCYFAQVSTFFTLNCDHVLHTLSSLALSVFELLLFFDHKDLLQEPLKHFTVTFQKCHSALARHRNVHLLQVEHMVRGGGPWAWPALQAILGGANLPQSEVDGFISSELPVFFELRVRYLLSCERVGEAMALAKCCAWHPTAGQHLFFLQVYLTWLFKTSQHESLHKEVSNLNGKDAIHIICSMECEEEDELLLALSRAFLSQQLCRGDMYYLCDLVLVWSKLHHRLKTSKHALLEEIHRLMLSATNVNSIFPFIRAILQEVGDDGIQFCVELCANALKSCLPCDVVTKALIYKTIAGLLPNDLEVCRACALLVFFLERTVEAYKIVYLLYRHPDQEYHVDNSPIRNNVRFETLQVLKKDLYFDPEFWNLIALRSNCLKLMSEKVVSSALEEIMEDKWIFNYSTKEPAQRSNVSVCQKGNKRSFQAAAKKRLHKEDRQQNDNSYAVSKRLKVGQDKPPLGVNHTAKRKGNQRPLKDAPCQPLRRSFWQIDRLQGNGFRGERRTTRLSEKNPPKRRIKKPKWLLEDSGTLEENNAPLKIKRHGLKNRKHHHNASVEKRAETGQIKSKTSVDYYMERENSKHKEFSPERQTTAPPQVILELSLPDNELMGSFIEETCNRQRGYPQVLLYKPTVKLPATSLPLKTVHGSVSTITRSSVQGSPPKLQRKERCENPATCMKGGFASPRPAAGVSADSPVLEKVQTTKPGSRKTFTSRELPEKSAVEMKCAVASPQTAKAAESQILDKTPQAQSAGKSLQTKRTELFGQSEMDVRDVLPDTAKPTEPPRRHAKESSVEMKVTIASQTPTAGKMTPASSLDNICKSPTVKESSEITTSSKASKASTADSNHTAAAKEIPPMSDRANLSDRGAADSVPSQFHNVVLRDGSSLSCQTKTDSPDVFNSISDVDISCKGQVLSQNGTSSGTTVSTIATSDPDNVSDISALTLVTEMANKVPPEKQPIPEDDTCKESIDRSKPKVTRKLKSTLSCSLPASAVDDEQEGEGTDEIASETTENGEQVESDGSKLEFCCTFCNKDFKGSRVVAHAMFHYRKDECMFCGTMFKNDLLAMMHMSDHIEKLKRSKEGAGNKAQENGVCEAKDISTPKTSVRTKTANVCSEHRSSGRQRKSDVCSKSGSLADPSPSVSRKLRSNNDPSSQRKKQNSLKQLKRRMHVHKMNGHIGRKKVLDRRKADSLNSDGVAENSRQEENQDVEMDSTTSVQIKKDFSSTDEKMKETESLQVLKTVTKQGGKNKKPQETVCCPVDGCAWLTDVSKNRVALLYHALEDHFGEVKPLELAFRIGNSRCSICMRVLWSFEHFQHHVERHRLVPRHPCLHQDCTARFKTGIEMRRHARRHSPLQAACCLPGCSELFICLWALNLHERQHYASTKADKNTKKQTSSKFIDRPAEKTQLDHEVKDEAATTENKSLSAKATHKMDSYIFKILSNKDTPVQTTGPTLRLRQTLRKTNPNLAARKSHKVALKSLLKHNDSVRHKFNKKPMDVDTKPPKRRGRPPKSKMLVLDENTAMSQQDKTAGRSVELPSGPPKAAEASQENKELKDEKNQDAAQTTQTSASESKSKKPMQNRIKKSHAKQKAVATNSKPTNSLDPSDKAQKSANMKKSHKARRHSASEENGQTASKEQKVTNEPGEVSELVMEKLSESNSLVPQVDAKGAAPALEKCADEDGKANVENADSTLLAIPSDNLKEINSQLHILGEEAPKVTSEETSQKPPDSIKEETQPTKLQSIAGSSKKTIKHKDSNKKTVKERRASKDATKTSDLKKTAEVKSVDQQVEDAKTAVESFPDVVGEAKEASTSTPNCDSSEVTSKLAAAASDSTQKQKSKKNFELKRASKKRKVDPEDSDVKTVKKKCKDQSAKTAKKSKKEEKAEVVGSSVGEEGEKKKQSQSKTHKGFSKKINGQAAADDTPSTVCKIALAEYGKKPYLRAPPTAYLDEKYITMPKRRKEIPAPQMSQSLEEEKVPAAPKRQRCVNCFATFTTVDLLQSHLQLRKCSSLFGFDSDDEGNSSAGPNQTK
ncbi:titin homolog isoform X2 [Antennarius striatus]|uniref:titin homolog isoform X2 n=1 Tax=Antennarius striatus TaxID=241820 RepID=UPI0035B28B58